MTPLAKASRVGGVIIVAFGLLIYGLLHSGEISGEQIDFPNERNLIKANLEKKNAVEDIAGVIGFRPDTLCISASGVDPRYVYASNIRSGINFNLQKTPSYYEGYTIFLFANADKFYIEKFDHTHISFDELHGDHCKTISESFSITLSAPTNKYRYSRYSGKVAFGAP